MTKETILFEKHYFLAKEPNEILAPTTTAYLNAYLLANFGIEVDKPSLLTRDMIKTASDIMQIEVPRSFYANPQDMKYFSCEELAVEQLVSYLLVECTDGGALCNDNPEKFDRQAVFKKALPHYVQGDEIKLRKFNIITPEEANDVFTKIMKSYCEYTRPLSLDETEKFLYLIDLGFLKDDYTISCKETVFTLIDKLGISYSKYLDKKDIVKYSVAKLSDRVDFSNLTPAQKETLARIGEMASYARYCPLSKKQAKFYNKLIKECELKQNKVSNAKSPDKLANDFLRAGNIIEAAKVYAKNGSMLERRIKMLLSRANPREAVEILDLLPAKNPIALYQIVSNLSEDSNESRTFTFTKYNRVKTHIETDYETKWRKSRLSPGTAKLLHDEVLAKIDRHYSELPPLGKIYINSDFYRVTVPTNTSATGSGLDVAPAGSRQAIRGTAIRTFVRWDRINDVDADVVAIKVDNFGNFVASNYMYWRNYTSKPFGDAISFSGDNRSRNGVEFYDVVLDDVAKQGYRYVIFGFHGFTKDFNNCEVVCGYQDKANLMTSAWDPKNIEFQFNVKGDSSACEAFAIDLKTKELIILNQILDSHARVINATEFKSIAKWLSESSLELSMGRIIEHRGELVETPEEADIVFDNAYQPTEHQITVRTYDVDTLVSLVNDGTIELSKKEVVEN